MPGGHCAGGGDAGASVCLSLARREESVPQTTEICSEIWEFYFSPQDISLYKTQKNTVLKFSSSENLRNNSDSISNNPRWA